MFVLNYTLREFLLSAFAICFEFMCEQMLLKTATNAIATNAIEDCSLDVKA